jgi:lysozyme
VSVYINADPGATPAAPGQSPDHGAGIKKDEGLSLKPYMDTGNKLHIGYGRNLTDKGITQPEAEILFENDLAEAQVDLSRNIFPGKWPSLPNEIKTVLINMRFQLGIDGFREFENMISAIRLKDWDAAAGAMRNSLWYQQTPARAMRLIEIVESVGKNGD